jgi:hypothetical protein
MATFALKSCPNAWGFVDDVAQLRMNRYFEVCFFAAFGLGLIDG